MMFFFFCLFLPAAADIPIDRSARLRVGLMEDQITFAVDTADKLKNLVGKAKGALLKLYSQIFPRLAQVSGLEVLTGAFWAHHRNPIEVIKRNHRLLGATLVFQQLMGHKANIDFKALSSALPLDDEGDMADLSAYRLSSRTCAANLINLVDEEKAQCEKEAADAAVAEAAAAKDTNDADDTTSER